MTKAEIYRKAARLIEECKVRDSIPGACSAISDAMYPRLKRGEAFCLPQTKAVIEPFEDLFRPDGNQYLYWGESWGDTEDKKRGCRATALCFMAAMVEAGDA